MVSRRTFLATSTAAAGALVAPAPFTSLAAQSVPRRRRISELSSTDPVVSTYREGVRRLKAARGPVTWETIAKIHADYCPHSNWYFLPWHRAYLVMVENIIRDVTGDRAFAMPYWDWTRDRRLPVQFTQASVANNPLHERSRTISAQFGFPDETVGPDVIAQSMGETDFESFGSGRPNGQNSTAATWIRRYGAATNLEALPHNEVHNTLGGEMADMMSPRDPIFWLHHCNIDRIWADWNQNGNANSNNGLWLGMTFNNHFLRPDGSRYSVVVRDLQAILPLGYRYGLGPEQPRRPVQDPPMILSSVDQPSRAGRGRAATSDAPVRRFTAPAAEVGPGKPLTVSVGVAAADVRSAVAAPAQSRGRAAGRAATADATAAMRVRAVVRDIKTPNGAAGTRFNVFLASSDGASSLGRSSPEHVGSFGLFGGGAHTGHGDDAGHGDRSVLLDLTPALRRMQAAGRSIGDKIELTLVAEPLTAGDKAVAVQPGRIDITVE